MYYEVDKRDKSWEHCYGFFRTLYEKYSELDEKSKNEQEELACLHLANYMESWGMYRGSSFLLRFDYQIYKGVVEIIFSDDWDTLWMLY